MTLQERLEEVMREMSWGHADLVRVSKQSSSVVSQWLGNGSKTIHSIGKIEAAMNIAEATGYSAKWIAKGIGPKREELAPEAAPRAHEPPASYGASPSLPPEAAALLRDMQDAMKSPRLAKKLTELRAEVAEMREFARNLQADQPAEVPTAPPVKRSAP